MGPSFFYPGFGYHPYNRFYGYTNPNNIYGYSREKQGYKKENLNSNENLNSSNKNISSTATSSRDYDKNEKPVFELFGIKLFFDDILLISLIFFLYNEGVHDESLFVSLILLLLS